MSVLLNQTLPMVIGGALTDIQTLSILSVIFIFLFLFVIGLRERIVMVMAGIVGFFIPILIVSMDIAINSIALTLLIFPGVVCIGIAISRKRLR